MKNSKADLLLHPIRLRIIQIFIGGRELTVQQVAEYLKDIPQATLYRHFNLLVQGNMLSVVKHNQVRGAIEKVYAITNNADNRMSNGEKVDREDLMKQFMLFISMLIDDFEAYTSRENEIDPFQDGVGFRQASFFLSDKELHQLYEKIGKAFQEVAHNEPSADRKRRTISTILMPGRESNNPDYRGEDE
ncbi:helix-turn-helix domain-containing protein [Paenibacillus sp. 1001270B_150601_E10]|uniref:helix-turn-helix domain-containing protein n=1 Tax=Paenibacillus sp. 1001270B_150601_E10 TaxID=2787079 RepID=UPI00189E7D74|nr:helix-turn-helix domain-containing protein [Paenibacillus sp. 1001270B_150601_E10]